MFKKFLITAVISAFNFAPVSASTPDCKALLSEIGESPNALKELTVLRKCVAELATTAHDLSILRAEFDKLKNRKWHSVINQRAFDRTYPNDTEFPIEVSVTTRGPGTGQNSNSCDVQFLVDNRSIVWSKNNMRDFARFCSFTATVPPGSFYTVSSRAYPTNGGAALRWMELRVD
jgi:hypothetical protein